MKLPTIRATEMPKNNFLLLCVLLFSACEHPNQSKELITETVPAQSFESYDSVKAIQYGADDYGMKSYVVAFLMKGDAVIQDKEKSAELQKAHLKNIDRLAELNKLVLAGPFMDNGEMRGVYVFDVATIEEARELTASDPAIQAGVLKMELKPWYGSAALMEVNSIHNTLLKKSTTD